MAELTPPVAPRRPHTWHRPTGDETDDWAWLADRDDPETRAYLEAENTYTSAWFADHQQLTADLFDEIKSRVQETDQSVATRKGEWWYVTRTFEGKNYPVHCRGRSRESATDDVLLDQNELAVGHEYLEVGAFDISPSSRLLAYSTDTDGGEIYEMRIRDLDTGADLDDVIPVTYYGTAWAADDAHLFYTVPDEQMRPYQVWRHQIGAPAADDVLVLQEDDERFNLQITLSRDEQWIVISSDSRTTSEAWLISATDPMATPASVRPRVDEIEYSVEPWGDQFLVLTNLEAEDFRVMSAPLDAPGEWTEVLPGFPGRRITQVEAFASHFVVHEWHLAQPQLRVVFRDGSEMIPLTGTEPCDVEFNANPEWNTESLRFSYQSMTTPHSIYEDHFTDGREVLKVTNVPGVDFEQYTSTRLWAPAPDGTSVPVVVVHRVDTKLDGTAPTCLYGYGSYEASSPPWFSAARISLLDRGWVFAVAQIRGGGELGRHWYLDGKLLNKRNTFTDFIAAGEHLIAEGYCAPGRLAIRGGSAGGLLVGASMTMRPDLFSTVIAEVPFVDVVSSMSNPDLPLTIGEWEEWGDPRVEPYATYMRSYSPYDNVAPVDYPALYITSGLNDPRVMFHEPTKWAARLRATATGTRPLLLKTEMGAGHGGPSGRYDAWRDEAQTLAFLLRST